MESVLCFVVGLWIAGIPGEFDASQRRPELRPGVRIIAALTPPGVRAYFPDPRLRAKKDERREAYLPTQSNSSPPQARFPRPDEDEGWPEDARPSSRQGP